MNTLLSPDFKKRKSYQLYDKFLRDRDPGHYPKFPGLYVDPNSPDPKKPRFLERPFVRGRQTFRALKSRTPTAAVGELQTNRTNQRKSRAGLAVDPYTVPRKAVLTTAQMLDNYAAAGFPKKRNITSPRSPGEIKQQEKHLEHLKKFFGEKNPKDLTSEDLTDYHAWRIHQIAERRAVHGASPAELPNGARLARPGHRAVDIERVTLSNAYDLAIDHTRQTGIAVNPFARKVKRFRHSSQVIHCRDFQPESPEELHRLAGALFDAGWKSEALAWQLLFESLIGQRSHEILKLRMDATNSRQPGYITKNCLYLYRSNTHKGTYPYAELHPALKQCLAAHLYWHTSRFPAGNPWYLPSPAKPRTHLCPTSLTHALRPLTEQLGLPRRKSHGFRSYYVNVLRSGGDRGRKISDAEIALRIGHRSQGKLIVEVYGEILPYPLTWLPETAPPAWSRWIPQTTAAEQLTLGL